MTAVVERLVRDELGLGSCRPALDAGITSPYAYLRQYVVSSTVAHDIGPAVPAVSRTPEQANCAASPWMHQLVCDAAQARCSLVVVSFTV
ncbi:hypothetical protein [Streptomyces avermitilis]|uniref:hypothetical protein n=1 Tax=Streptomyces avermitilis TaxID=33903 RepID=UPI0033BC3872